MLERKNEPKSILTDEKRSEVENYIKEHLPGDQGEAVKVA